MAVTLGAAETIGNVVAGCVVWQYNNNNGTLTSITDGGTSNSFSLSAVQTVSAKLKTASFWAPVTQANTTITATWGSPGVQYSQLVVSEVSGGRTTGIFHIENLQTNPGAAADAITSTVLATGGADFIFGCSSSGSGQGTTTAGTGFTVRRNDTVNGNWSLISEDAISNASTRAATFTDVANGASGGYYAALIGILAVCPPPSRTLLGAGC